MKSSVPENLPDIESNMEAETGTETSWLSDLQSLTSHPVTIIAGATPVTLDVYGDDLLKVCRFFLENPECYCDRLVCVTGIDNGPEAASMEVVYHLDGITTGKTLALRVKTTREDPEVPSLCSIWEAADWLEREVFDMYGIRFSGHPDLRRILLPADWEGFPLRKDYTAAKTYHGLEVDAPTSGTATQRVNRPAPQPLSGSGDELLSKAEPEVISSSTLRTEEMVINLGPQHPSTHGVLRLECLIDGEVVQRVVPHIGYLHRCFEKHAENLPFNQIIPFVDRLDYVAAMNNEHVFALGVERMLGLEGQLPRRVEYIRVLVAELNRIASHFIALGTYGLDLGAFTPMFWLMKDREHILRLLEWVSGARLLYNYIWVGGLYYDLPVGFEEQVREFTRYLEPKLDELDIILVENSIFISRTAGVGVLSLDRAIAGGATGPVLRGSGLRHDLRKIDGYSIYPELDFQIPIGEGKMGVQGDCWDRTWVRAREIRESVRIINQCLDRLTSDLSRSRDFDPQALVPGKIRPKAQDFYSRAETPKGELGFFFRTDGKSDVPLRCKVRSCSFSNLSLLPELCRGVLLADLIAIVGSIDVVMGEVDR